MVEFGNLKLLELHHHVQLEEQEVQVVVELDINIVLVLQLHLEQTVLVEVVAELVFPVLHTQWLEMVEME